MHDLSQYKLNLVEEHFVRENSIKCFISRVFFIYDALLIHWNFLILIFSPLYVNPCAKCQIHNRKDKIKFSELILFLLVILHKIKEMKRKKIEKSACICIAMVDKESKIQRKYHSGVHSTDGFCFCSYVKSQIYHKIKSVLITVKAA